MELEDGGSVEEPKGAAGHASPRDDTGGPVPDFRTLTSRIAELEAELSALRAAPGPGSTGAPGMSLPRLELRALRVIGIEGWGEGWSIRPSPQRRHWMDENTQAYHCLPLVMANQWGWQLLCPTEVVVTWDGDPGAAGLQVQVDPRFTPSIKSQFGSGIVTFSPPWLFRTSPGWDLYVKGPSNRWKPNCMALEGVVETWWLNYTFTLNWKVVEPGTVVFARGESLAQLVPVPHGTFVGATALEAPINQVEPDAARELLRWREERRRIAAEPVVLHRLYRRAEGVEGHLQSVPVPKVEAAESPRDRTPGESGGS